MIADGSDVREGQTDRQTDEQTDASILLSPCFGVNKYCIKHLKERKYVDLYLVQLIRYCPWLSFFHVIMGLAGCEHTNSSGNVSIIRRLNGE